VWQVRDPHAEQDTQIPLYDSFTNPRMATNRDGFINSRHESHLAVTVEPPGIIQIAPARGSQHPSQSTNVCSPLSRQRHVFSQPVAPHLSQITNTRSARARKSRSDQPP
jgi:hypothetical protein